MRTHEGWKFEWTASDQPSHIVKSVIPGPFFKPKLVKAIPYIVFCHCKSCNPENEHKRRLRSGIPDPWLEYLTWKENQMLGNGGKIASRDVRLSWEYLRIVDHLWMKNGLAMLQGIPDPWRTEENSICENAVLVETKKRRGSRRKESTKIERERIESEAKSVIKNQIDDRTENIAKKRKNKPKRTSDFDEFKQALSEFDKKLTINNCEKRRSEREIQKPADSKSKSHRKHSKKKKENLQHSDREISPQKCVKVISRPIIKENTDTEKVLRRFGTRCNDDTCEKKNGKKKSHSTKKSSREKSVVEGSPDRSLSPCRGGCGRFSREQQEPRNSCGCSETGEVSAKPNARVSDVSKHLKEEFSKLQRIKVTPKPSKDDTATKKLKSPQRKRGGGCAGNEITYEECEAFDYSVDKKDIDKDKQYSRFFENTSETRECEASSSPYLKCRYQEGNLNSATNKKDDGEQLIIESYSERD